MKLVETHKYRFPSYLLPALINNDHESIGEDKNYLNTFLDRLEKYRIEYGASHYEVDYGSDSYFAKSNCLFDVGCNVTDIKVLFLR
jgi:hypothetical protein